MKHTTVLLNETIESLSIKKDGIYVDLTLGLGGHSEAILNQLEGGFLYAFDQDENAIAYAKKRLSSFSNLKIIHANFKDMKALLKDEGIDKVDGIIMDLGMSSYQIDDLKRGFSYLHDAPLDMRMNQRLELTAEKVLNTYDVKQLEQIFRLYGEEPNSYKIAQDIVKNRPLKTSNDLVEITDKYKKRKGHSAKRVFQALRIYINDEINVLESVLPDALSMLNKEGVLAVITFHSLEDRLVKETFKELCEEPFLNVPTLPKEMPFKYYRKKITPSIDELNHNPRSKSAILRAVIKN
ncbi:MAG: 16S rRNA (cytosine(1402)-N(4))-methyltransferase RsmH [Acholeplasmataceae bacterium]